MKERVAMGGSRLPLTETLANLPPPWPQETLPAVRTALAERRQKLVVLDDDPTGTQTVHDIPVLTHWSVTALKRELDNDLSAFYLLTNSRSLLLPAAQQMNAEIGRNLKEAAQATGHSLAVVSRSDSTLRGHFPGEVEYLAAALGGSFDAWLLIPFFLEGGRYTIDDVHYVAEGDWLIPAGETAYATDATFGYQASNLRQWVEEKTGGRVTAQAVAAITIEDVRVGGPRQVMEKLLSLTQGAICVVNAASMRDLGVFVQGLLAAEAQGRRYLYRTAASFVPVRAGLAPRPLLTAADLDVSGESGALFVVGSYVPKTTSQVSQLLAVPGMVQIEIDVRRLLDEAQREAEIARVGGEASEQLAQGKDVTVFTSRELITGVNAAESRHIGQRISSGLIAAVHAIDVRPRYLLAKGGITSSDVATIGLGVERVMVRGQIVPGVPVWELGDESRFPGLTYVVFPGNVGGPDALVEIRETLMDKEL
jgi:uncharacterized protein YgbK (DUF1537 family)